MKRTSVALCFAVLLCAVQAFAQQAQSSKSVATLTVPHLIKFGGMVNQSKGKTVGITFALYKEQQSGAALWLETQNVSLDASGRYRVLLGASKAEGVPMELFTSGEARWLGVQVEGRKEQSRVLLVSVPYALKAADAETLAELAIDSRNGDMAGHCNVALTCLFRSKMSSPAVKSCCAWVADFAGLPGDLVSLVPSAQAKVRKSAKRYEPLLLGVVSTNPGLVFDAGKTHLAGDNSGLVTKDKTVVALVGRVPVKISMENGPIRVGDPLTSSSKSGIAMKATAAGKIIGYALASANKEGKVLAFVQPGYYAAPQLASLKVKFARLHHDNVKLHAENVNLRNQFLGLTAQIKQIRAQLDSDQARSAKLVGLRER